LGAVRRLQAAARPAPDGPPRRGPVCRRSLCPAGRALAGEPMPRMWRATVICRP